MFDKRDDQKPQPVKDLPKIDLSLLPTLSDSALSFDLNREGPNFYRQSDYSADPRKVALREQKEIAAEEVFGQQPIRAPVIIPKNSNGPTNWDYVINALRERGVDITAPMEKRVFSSDRMLMMTAQGTDRSNGLSLTSHHGGDDGEWLAMIEYGLKTHETSRTTFSSPFTERDKHELIGGVFGDALAVYDARGLIDCQPSHNKTNSFSNGHKLFVADPHKALIAVIR